MNLNNYINCKIQKVSMRNPSLSTLSPIDFTFEFANLHKRKEKNAPHWVQIIRLELNISPCLTELPY